MGILSLWSPLAVSDPEDLRKGAGLGGGELQASPGGGASFLTLVPALTALPLRGSCSVHRANPPLASFTLNLKSLQTRLVISGTK